MSPRAFAKKISTDEGGLSQSPPFFLCRAVRAAMALMAGVTLENGRSLRREGSPKSAGSRQAGGP
jgi:hypothetical protein